MHAVALTHRDVTPRNVLRMADGRLVLTDFGLAIEHDAHTTVHGGTPAYMPPEAARGERSDQRSDVFQLGMIIHEILTGVRPAWTPDGPRLVVAEPAPGASPVEEELARLVSDCVNVDPARRPVSAVAVAGRLAAAEVARPAPLPLRLLSRARRFGRRHTRLLVVGGGGGDAGGGGAGGSDRCHGRRCARAPSNSWRGSGIRRGPRRCGGRSWPAARAMRPNRSARVRAALDEYGAAWTHMYTDACEATHLRGEQSDEVLDLRMGCLKDGAGRAAGADRFCSRPPTERSSRVR